MGEACALLSASSCLTLIDAVERAVGCCFLLEAAELFFLPTGQRPCLIKIPRPARIRVTDTATNKKFSVAQSQTVPIKAIMASKYVVTTSPILMLIPMV